MGMDCILSLFKLIRLSLQTNSRAVSEGEPYPNHNGLRFFTRGLPNLKSYYDKRGHYPVYYQTISSDKAYLEL